MSLASALMKRYFVSKTLEIPWKSVTIGRRADPQHGKPCYIPEDGSSAALEFNVSHQAGLVSLVGSSSAAVELGIDIVCVNERDDYRTIDASGFDGWVDMYHDFFSPKELLDMKYEIASVEIPGGLEVTAAELGEISRCCTRNQQLIMNLASGEEVSVNSNLLIEAKLRRFYAFWCYKEAYIKLSGEAMLAPWLRQLEFTEVTAPRPGNSASSSGLHIWGETRVNAQASINGIALKDLWLSLQAFEESYMIGIAAKPASIIRELDTLKFEMLQVEDILTFVANS